MTNDGVALDGSAFKAAFDAELAAVALAEPTADAVIREGKGVLRKRRLGVAVMAVAAIVAGPSVYLATQSWPGQHAGATMVSVGSVPPGADPDVVGRGMLDGHTWEVRAKREADGSECTTGSVDGQQSGRTCGSPPQVLVGDPVEGIGHLNYSTGPFGDAFGSVVGVASDDVAVIVVRVDHGREFRVTPEDVGLGHRYFAFAYDGSSDFRMTAYDAQGRELARGAPK